MRRGVGTVALALGLLAVAACGVGGLGDADDVSSGDEGVAAPFVSGEQARAELDDVLASTESARGGTFETSDDLTGDVSRAAGTFTQDPPAFEVSFDGEGGRPGGRFVLVDGVTYGQDGDEPWIELGPVEAGAPLLDVGAVPSQLLQVVLDEDAEPTGIEPIDGAAASYRWRLVAEDVGFPSSYEGTSTVVDVAVDDEGRVVQVQARVDRLDEAHPGGAFTIDFTYDVDTAPITAPADVVALEDAD